MDNKRPISITIISWFFILISIFSIALKTYTLTNPESYEMFKEFMSLDDEAGLITAPLWFEMILSYLISSILVLAGILMLQGRILGRSLTIICILGSLVFSFLSTGSFFLILIKIPITLLIVFLLFHQKASHYFKQ
ncbi:MAG: hypothetical protein ACKE9I_03425 [Methylophagaceae bacterium]